MNTWDGTAEGWGRGIYRDIPWSKYVLMARARHKKDLERSLSGDPDFPYYYDNDAADHAVWFLSTLRLVEGEWAGQKWKLSDWQEWDIIRPLFGWKRRDNNKRRFRLSYIEIARKNAKSTLAAGISLYLLLADKESRGQVYAAATKESQASIVWGIARDMLNATPEFKGYIKQFKKSIFVERSGSIFQPLGRDSDTQDGFSVHGAVVDEYHAHKTAEMLNVLKSGRGARRQPLIVIITTAGSNTSSPCKAESDRAKRVLEGQLESDETFYFVATVDDPDKWEDEVEQQKANPNLGISIHWEGFRSDFKDAQTSATARAEFKRKNLNIWTGEATKWLSLPSWTRCGQLYDPKELIGRPCWGGLDLGISRDLSTFVLAFKIGELARENQMLPIVALIARFWIPSVGKQEKYLNDGVNYPQWVEEGHIIETPGETTRYDYVEQGILQLAEIYDIKEIAHDPTHAHHLTKILGEDHGMMMVKHSQSFTAMNFPVTATEEMIVEGRLRHGNNPVLTWQAGNAVAIQDAYERVKLAKDKSAQRIDGMVATVMAVGRLLIAPEDEFAYASRGIAFG